MEKKYEEYMITSVGDGGLLKVDQVVVVPFHLHLWVKTVLLLRGGIINIAKMFIWLSALSLEAAEWVTAKAVPPQLLIQDQPDDEAPAEPKR